ncbi:PREDICTED: STIP1 homology and U box-containing protein 1-like [Amphimedon queenslandica]|uniref:E3 ubiquitin-protein ligase CHIP n=1 Tax=Amphimedon queenslandica TaxID=400682 RepID=A0A1X7VQ98_AMPQE|nr:PREDICTED: STIP1 homology and U box-containing protein 1-like [Amphimedon queenslandica]|eukprot:XP_003382966.1 PREDICTED: STIP1 homology and U box-containing protein 1-like [Amphimedon queenslandica]
MEARSRGNRFFSQSQYKDALESYSSALTKTPKDSRLFTNRALCHIKLGQWSSVIDDCQTAIQIDPAGVKAHFYIGQAYTELGNHERAIEAFETAHKLAKEQRRNFGDDIASALRQAKRKRWQEKEEQRLNQQSDLLHLLNDLLLKHKDELLAESNSLSIEEQERESEVIVKQHDERLKELKRVFEEADASRKSRDVPDYLCGKISFELMEDPVITPSGITYDRKDIEEHLNRVGHFDPITRTKLTSDQLTSNLAMKEVVDAFVTENEWIEDY